MPEVENPPAYYRMGEVLFISTGAHADYHTPLDNLASINMEGAAEVMQFAADIAEVLANEKEQIAIFVPSLKRDLLFHKAH